MGMFNVLNDKDDHWVVSGLDSSISKMGEGMKWGLRWTLEAVVGRITIITSKI